MTYSLFAISFLLGFFPCGVVRGQNETPQAADSKREPIEEVLSVTRLMPQVAELEQRLTALKIRVAQIADLPEVAAGLNQIQEELDLLEQWLQKLDRSRAYLVYDSLIDWEIRLEVVQRKFEDLTEPVSEMLAYLEASHQFWQKEKPRWEQWQDRLPATLSPTALEPTFDKVRKLIAEAIRATEFHLERLVDLQRQAVDIQTRIHFLSAGVDGFQAEMRTKYFRRIFPPLFSSRYYEQLQQGLTAIRTETSRDIPWPEEAIVRWIHTRIIFQVLLALAVFALLQRNRHRLETIEDRHFLSRRPIAACLFIGFMSLYGFFPVGSPFIDLTQWSIISLAAARLMGGVGEKPWASGLFGLLAALMIVTLLLRMLALPTVFARLYFTVAGAAVLALCARLASQSIRNNESVWFSGLLGLLAAVFGVVVVAEITGHSYMAFYVFESSLATIYIVVLAFVLIRAVRLLLEAGIQNAALQRIAFIRSNQTVILRRLRFVIDFGFIIYLAGLLVAAWQLRGTPTDAIGTILAIGLRVGELQVTIGLALTAFGLLYGALMISLAVRAILTERIFPKRNMEIGVQVSVSRIIHYFIVFTGFILALLALGVNLTNITIIGGALGIGIGFGLQSIVNNFVSGLILLFERSVKEGDFITISGQFAEIKNLGLRSTIVRTLERSEIIVPNSDLIANQVTNWTLSDRKVRITIPVGVAYGSDVDLVVRTLMDSAQAQDEVSAVPAPQVLVLGFGENALQFELRAWVYEVKRMIPVRSQLVRDLARRFEAMGITIAFPQRDLHIPSLEELLKGKHKSPEPFPGSGEDSA